MSSKTRLETLSFHSSFFRTFNPKGEKICVSLFTMFNYMSSGDFILMLRLEQELSVSNPRA